MKKLLSILACLLPLAAQAGWTLDGRLASTNTVLYQPVGDYYTSLDLDQFTLVDDGGTLKVADRIELNLMYASWRLSVLESREASGFVDTWLDAFSDQTGIQTGASVHAFYDTNALAYANFAPDALGSALIFSNSADNVLRTNAFAYVATGNAPFTVTWWARVDDLNAGDEYFWFIGNDEGRLACLLWSGVNLGINYGSASYNVEAMPQDNGWHHYAYTYSPPTVALYVDTSNVVSEVIDPLNQSADSRIVLGAYDSDQSGLKGALDEFAVFNQALNPAQVGLLFSNEYLVASSWTNLGLQLLLHLDEGSGTTLTDAGPHSLSNWTFRGAATWTPGAITAPGAVGAMTLLTTNILTTFAPDTALASAYIELVDPLGGLDPTNLLTCALSRNAGTGWTPISLSRVAVLDQSPVIYLQSGTAAVTSPTGTNLVFRLTATDQLRLRLRGLGGSWK